MNGTDENVEKEETNARRRFLKITSMAAVAGPFAGFSPVFAQVVGASLIRGMAPVTLISHRIAITSVAHGHAMDLQMKLEGSNSVTGDVHFYLKETETAQSRDTTLVLNMQFFALGDETPRGNGSVTMTMHTKKGPISSDGKHRSDIISWAIIYPNGHKVEIPPREVTVKAIADRWRTPTKAEIEQFIRDCNGSHSR